MQRWYRFFAAVEIGLFALLFFAMPTSAAPMLANYYLGTLPEDAASINILAKFNVLILSPEQAVIRRQVIDQIKRINPKIILLAYVPTKSYSDNWRQYPFNTVYGDLKVQDDWWLKDSNGNITSDWPGHKNTNLSAAWSDYLVDYVNNKILSAGVWDGVFWDVVYDGISWFNHGDIDLNNDGKPDEPRSLDEEWMRRIAYLLNAARARLPVTYSVINGSSNPILQKLINGRMYENYPTPWESGGSWSGLMNAMQRNQLVNQKPQLYIFNANTNNTGKKTDYRQMRFGLVSSLLMSDAYFSFDYGDKNHSQLWWYDEYNVKLGEPIGPAQSLDGRQVFGDGVWRRDYTNGLAIVNATDQPQEVDLGGEYEKIIGEQDKQVNDGAIVDRARLGARDGLVMLKTFQSVSDLFFGNGAFLRFFSPEGRRARNGFFAFEEGLPGGAEIYHTDLDGDSAPDKIVATGPKLEIFNSRGERWFNDYPFGGDFKGKLRVAVGRLLPGKDLQIVVAPSVGGRIIIYDYHGGIIKDDFYPLGKKYQGGFTVAIGESGNDAGGQLVVGTREPGGGGEVLVYDGSLEKIITRFFPYGKNNYSGVSVAAGKVTGNNQYEIITAPIRGSSPLIKIFTATGKNLSSWGVGKLFGARTIGLGAVDVNYDGLKEIVVMNGN